ncbi:MAG: Uma2 family endonuclease [Rivularia sp. (in: cyanobacteria)]
MRLTQPLHFYNHLKARSQSQNPHTSKKQSSIIPDIAEFKWDNIAFTADGDVPDNFENPPDWTIEILSPQKPNKIIGNILHCLKYGTRLGWFLDADDSSILIFEPGKQPVLFQGEEVLLVLPEIELTLTPNQVFAWLKMSGN